jgi:hypothetical protein
MCLFGSYAHGKADDGNDYTMRDKHGGGMAVRLAVHTKKTNGSVV